MKRQTIGLILIGLIVGGISIHAWYTAGIAPVVFASGQEAPQLKTILIGVHIDWTEERIKLHIRESFPEQPELALAIAKCESNLNKDAVNTKNKDGSVDRGLWQINSTHSKTLQTMGIDPFDVIESTKFARKLYDKRGWIDWVCYTKKLY